MEQLTEKRIIIRHTLVHYYVGQVRDSGNPTLLFLHGWRSDAKAWTTIANRMNKEGYQVYSMDLPGFGGSEAPKTAWNLQDYAEIVREFIAKLHLQHVVLVGHSFGGRVAIKLTAEEDSIVEKLVLVDSAGIRGRERSRARLIAKLLKPIFAPSFMRGARRRIYNMIGAEDYVATPKLQEIFVNIINEDLTGVLSCIVQPTLIIWGEDDRITPLEHAYTMEQHIPHIKLVVIPDAGHFSFIDQPEKFIDVILSFVRG